MRSRGKILKRIFYVVLPFLFILVVVLGTDLYWEWITLLAHGPEYVARASVLLVAGSLFITAMLALAASISIEESEKLRKDSRRRGEIDRGERRLNEVMRWATELNEYALKRRTEALVSGGSNEFIEDQNRELFEKYESYRS